MSEKKTVLITGGASGIGYETAKLFLQNGYNAAIIDINTQKKDEVIRELSAFGQVSYEVCDLRQIDNIESAVREAVKPFGRLDTLVNNASVGAHDYMLDITSERWDSYINLALKAMFFVAQAASRLLIETNSAGTIVNISSGRVNNADGKHMLYSVAKTGITAMTRELAFSLGMHGIRVNAVLPGFVHTGMTAHYFDEDSDLIERVLSKSALPKVLSPVDIANVIYFLASESNSCITGQSIVADAGMYLSGLTPKAEHS